MAIEGHCAPAFQRVRKAFEANFAERGEVGASVAVSIDGEMVVDLWGGLADPARGRPWAKDTIACTFSSGKAMPALALLMLIERGLLDLDRPVADYWPEFASGGKGAITVEQLMGGRAGVLFADGAPDGALLDTPAMLRALEIQAAEWPAGTVGAYHSLTSGLLNSELLRRVDGRDFKTFFEDEITGPLDAGLRIGLTDADLARVADIIVNPASTTLNMVDRSDNKLARAWRVSPRPIRELINDDDYRRAVFPSGNFHGNARALAMIYTALVGGPVQSRLLGPAMIERIRRPQWEGICRMTERDYRYGLGFFLPQAPDTDFSPNPYAFGHPGVGGALGFADPDVAMAFGYVPNFLCAGQGLGNRCEALAAAAYASIGIER